MIYTWGKRRYNAAVAVIATFLFSFLPPILAHAGLATTDMALTASLGAAFLTALLWAEQPTWRERPAVWRLHRPRGGLQILQPAVLSRGPRAPAGRLFVFLSWPSAGSLSRSIRQLLPSFAAAVASGAIVIVAVYGGSLSPLFEGIRAVMAHNAEGHPTYLLGQRSASGFWYFYPVVLAVKTPLAMLILLGVALWLTFRDPARLRRDWPALAFAGGILLVAVFSRIQIGVRHILPVYFALCLLAATTVPDLLERARARPWLRWLAVLLMAWFAVSSLSSHPDYLAYTNVLVGSSPEKVLADSDLDWGQDTKRLAQRLRQPGLTTQVTFDPIVLADFEGDMGFPQLLPGNPVTPSAGWNAVSISYWKVRRLGLMDSHPEATLWPDHVPTGQRVGKGILLWYFPPRAQPPR